MSMLKAFTWPSSSDASALPLPDTVELLLPVVVNANDPVGFGGLMTSKASRRISAPNLMVWRPRTRVNVSRNSVIDVVNLEFAAVVGPICWSPVTVKIGRTDENWLGGRPGTVMPLSCSDVWFRSRREYPTRNWFSARGERVQ